MPCISLRRVSVFIRLATQALLAAHHGPLLQGTTDRRPSRTIPMQRTALHACRVLATSVVTHGGRRLPRPPRSRLLRQRAQHSKLPTKHIADSASVLAGADASLRPENGGGIESHQLAVSQASSPVLCALGWREQVHDATLMQPLSFSPTRADQAAASPISSGVTETSCRFIHVPFPSIQVSCAAGECRQGSIDNEANRGEGLGPSYMEADGDAA